MMGLYDALAALADDDDMEVRDAVARILSTPDRLHAPPAAPLKRLPRRPATQRIREVQ